MKNSTFNFFVVLAVVIAGFMYKTSVGFIAILFAIIFLIYNGRAKMYFATANMHASKGNEEMSQMALKKAYETAPDNVTIANSYGYALLKRGNIEEADAIFTKIASSPSLKTQDKIDVELNRSIVLWKNGKQDESIAHAEQLHDNHKNTIIYGTLGYYYILQGDLERALEFNQEAYQYNENNNAIIDNLALTYYMLGQYEEAFPLFEKLVDRNPKFREAYYNAGQSYEQRGDWDKAYELYREAIQHKPALISHVTLKEIEAKVSQLETAHPKLLEENEDEGEATLDS